MTFMQGHNDGCNFPGLYGFSCAADYYGNFPEWCTETKTGYSDCVDALSGFFGTCKDSFMFYLDTVNPQGNS
jgi:hypothetical protein